MRDVLYGRERAYASQTVFFKDVTTMGCVATGCGRCNFASPLYCQLRVLLTRTRVIHGDYLTNHK